MEGGHKGGRKRKKFKGKSIKNDCVCMCMYECICIHMVKRACGTFRQDTNLGVHQSLAQEELASRV